MESSKETKKKAKRIFDNFWIFFTAVVFVSGFLFFVYTEAKNNMETNLQTKYDIQVGNFTKLKSDWDSERIKLVEDKEEYRNQRDEIQSELNVCKINSGKFNLTINNQNELSTTEYILNSSCVDKDVIIGELIERINSQDDAINILKDDKEELQLEFDNLKDKLPKMDKDFVGVDIRVSKGGTYQKDNGKFILSVTANTHNTIVNQYSVSFRLNGVSVGRNLGEYYKFTYIDGYNYTMNIVGTGNPSQFYVYRDE